MRRLLFAVAALAAAFFGTVDVRYGDARFEWHGHTLRHWDIVPTEVLFFKPACAMFDTGGWPCGNNPATSYTFTGPTTGQVGSPTSNFTVAGVGNVSPSVTITPNDSSHGGTFTPSTVTLSGTTPQNFTYTAASAGTYNLTTTNSGSLSNPSAISFTASSSPGLTIDSQEPSGVGQHCATSPCTETFTNTAGNLLIEGVACTDTGGGNPAISGVTYKGVSMTEIGTPLTYGSTNPTTVELFYLKSPATGANPVSISWSASGTYEDCIFGGISFDNTTSSPVGTLQSTSDTTGSSSAASVNVPGTLNGDYVVSMVATGSGVGGANSPATISWLLNVSGNSGGDNAGLNQTHSTGGTVTPTFAVTADWWGIVAVEIF